MKIGRCYAFNSKRDMKNSSKILIAIAAASSIGNFASFADEPTLSPRAKANQIRIVSTGHTDPSTTTGLTALGVGAKAKASGGNALASVGTSAKDPDLAHGRNALGVAAKAKAQGMMPSDSGAQIAPLR